jgi:hypothetical protein
MTWLNAEFGQLPLPIIPSESSKAAARHHEDFLFQFVHDAIPTQLPQPAAIAQMGQSYTLLVFTKHRKRLCYKSPMPKVIEQWLLFTYVGREFTPLSKPFKTKEQAEKARLKYPERQRKTIGLGVIRTKQ